MVIATFGVVLVIAGFYAMSYGFKTPPDIPFFFIGLFITVLGILQVVIFGSKIKSSRKRVSKSKKSAKDSKNVVKPKEMSVHEIKPEVSKKSDKKKNVEQTPEKIKPVSAKLKEKMPEGVKNDKAKDQYVKDGLERLKENSIKNTSDIENLIEERINSFKGTLNKVKFESKSPGIIWSFDSGDVRDTMHDTILKADKKVLLMYPWIRNIDVSVLKRFMEIDAKMILQEPNLDDDASVELIKLLMENNVKIRTMPHVHTVAIVSDEDNGLIISTDSIYDSFEVGMIYKDQRSVEEIERMFEEVWGLSQEIDLSLNN
ncbi:MAG: hypothetical protein PQ964_08675 [Methanobacteriaceae archaeon]|jgi:hypothetical protein